MTPGREPVPVVLFVHRRPHHLRLTLAGLKACDVPLLIVYCDGPRDAGDEPGVAEVRELVTAIDWCPTRIVARDRNLGLGTSIRTGVTEVLRDYEKLIVFEDDLVCVPGTVRYLTAALEHYEHERRVMSVTGYTHPDVRPPVPPSAGYFDGRFTCWVWGTWRRAWRGMDVPAARRLIDCRLRLRNVWRYGADIPAMARDELSRDIWAVRFGLLHMLRRGLAYHPPHSMVDHIGFDDSTTSAGLPNLWELSELELRPPLPEVWPDPVEHPAMPGLWQAKAGTPPPLGRRLRDGVMRARWRLGAALRPYRSSGGEG